MTDVTIQPQKAQPKMTAKERQTIKDRQTIDGYDKILTRVREMQKLTTTPAWRAIYDWLRALANAHEKAILTEEKTRAIIAHQEAIKVVHKLMDRVRGVVDELNHYCASMPLFASAFRTRARWNEGLGIVETSDQSFVPIPEPIGNPKTGETR